ncbi:MAG: hypothetical protein Q4C70_04960 [Planctomycetia bacterium]|nr:hypothetical protein [Planctomycetia bacterium]
MYLLLSLLAQKDVDLGDEVQKNMDEMLSPIYHMFDGFFSVCSGLLLLMGFLIFFLQWRELRIRKGVSPTFAEVFFAVIDRILDSRK